MLFRSSTVRDITSTTRLPAFGSRSTMLTYIQSLLEEQSGGLRTALVIIADQRSVGMVTIRHWKFGPSSIGYWVLPPSRGKGVATQAVIAAVCGLINDRQQIQAIVDTRNKASLRVVEHCGFVRDPENDMPGALAFTVGSTGLPPQEKP